MSNVDAPDVSSGETNNPDLLAEQSGMPNMSSTKTFTVDTNMQVNGDLDVTGTVTATSFIGDGSQLTGISGGTGGGLDSAAVTLLVDSDYVQAREVPQDFAYSSLTGAPTALSSFTNDTSYITAADIPTTVDSDYVAARAPAGGGLEGFDVSAYDSATSNGIFEYNVSPGNQIRHLYSLNDAVAPTAYDGSVDYQVSWTMSSNQQFGFRDAGGFRTKVNTLAKGSTATTGLVLEGETFNNSGVELVGNVKLSSLPTSDPSEAGLLWNDGGIPVFSGSTAPSGGGGLDSAGVQGIVDDNITGGIASVQIGPSASAANALQQVVIGSSAFSTGQYNVAIGRNAKVQSSQTAGTAVGNDARVGSSQGGNNGVAIGTNAIVERNAGTAIGPNAYVKDGDNATAVGMQANAWGASAVALGHGANATGSYGLALGFGATASGTASFAIGSGAVSERVNSMSIGTNAGRYINGGDGHIVIGDQAGGAAVGGGGAAHNLVAIGTGASTDLSSAQYETVAIGYNAGRTNMGNYAVAIGSGASSSSAGQMSIGLGYNAKSTGSESIAIGSGGINGAQAAGSNAIAIGGDANASSNDAIDIRTSAAGSLTYDTTNDWTFGAGVTMTDLTASGATVVFSNLPTTDPVNAGQLWNDNGTLKVSAG